MTDELYAALIRRNPGQKPSVTARYAIEAYARELGIEAAGKVQGRKG